MSKVNVGGIYLDNQGKVFQITNANMYLVLMSPRNKAITIEYLDTKEELILSWDQLYESIVKHLGNNPVAARILYEKVLRSSHEEINVDLDPILSKYEPSDD